MFHNEPFIFTQKSSKQKNCYGDNFGKSRLFPRRSEEYSQLLPFLHSLVMIEIYQVFLGIMFWEPKMCSSSCVSYFEELHIANVVTKANDKMYYI